MDSISGSYINAADHGGFTDFLSAVYKKGKKAAKDAVKTADTYWTKKANKIANGKADAADIVLTAAITALNLPNIAVASVTSCACDDEKKSAPSDLTPRGAGDTGQAIDDEDSGIPDVIEDAGDDDDSGLDAGRPDAGEDAGDVDDGGDIEDTGIVDECVLGESRESYSGDPETEYVGICRPMVEQCQDTPEGARFVTVQKEVLPKNEICNYRDDDCDGFIDEELYRTTYSGPQGTLFFGTCQPKVEMCLVEGWYTTQEEILPQPEVCNDLDDNCNGIVDDPPVCEFGECEEGETKTSYTGPAGTEGVGICQPTILECDENSAFSIVQQQVTPQKETCNNEDDNCNGAIDEDLRVASYSGPDDTMDVGLCKTKIDECQNGQFVTTQEEVRPQEEICNNLDDNCNEEIDEGLIQTSYSGPEDTAGVGICKIKIDECQNGGFVTTQEEVLPKEEVCNDYDDDCNGIVDDPPVCEVPECEEGETVSSYSGPAGTENVGICKSEIKVCENGAFEITQAEVLPQEEINCNDIDEDCDGVASPGTFGKIGSDVRITNDSDYSGRPSLVWTGSEYGVSWTDGRDGNGEIYFTRISDTGIKIGNDVRITNNSDSSTLSSLVWTGSEFGVSWRDDRDGNGEIYFTRISDTGTKVGNDVRITNGGVGTQWPSLAWTGSEFGVSWDDFRDGSQEIYFARISNTGTKIGSDVRITNSRNPSSWSSLVWTGSEFGVSWDEGVGVISFARLSDTGIKIGSDVLITNGSSYSRWSSMVWTDSEYGVSWSDSRDGNYEIYFARISDIGTKTGSDVRITNDENPSRELSLVWATNEYGVSWQDNRDGNKEIYFARISESGTKIESDARITNASGDSHRPSLVWNDNEYGVSWEDNRDGNPEIYFARIGCQ